MGLEGSGFMAEDVGFRVQGLWGLRIWGVSGFRGSGFGV